MKCLQLVQPLSRCLSWGLQELWGQSGVIIYWPTRQQFHQILYVPGDAIWTWRISCWTNKPLKRTTGSIPKISFSVAIHSFAVIMLNQSLARLSCPGKKSNQGDGRCERSFSLAYQTMLSFLAISINFTRFVCQLVDICMRAKSSLDRANHFSYLVADIGQGTKGNLMAPPLP